MSIDIVSLRLQSAVISGNQLTDLMNGAIPSRLTEKGSMASRTPGGRKRELTTWAVESEVVDIEDLAPHVHAFKPLLQQIETFVRKVDVSVDIVVKVTARPMGWVVYLSSEELEILREAKCGLMMDVYNSDDANESDDEYRFSSELSSDLE